MAEHLFSNVYNYQCLTRVSYLFTWILISLLFTSIIQLTSTYHTQLTILLGFLINVGAFKYETSKALTVLNAHFLFTNKTVQASQEFSQQMVPTTIQTPNKPPPFKNPNTLGIQVPTVISIESPNIKCFQKVK